MTGLPDMNLFRMSVKNIFRNKRKTLLTLTAVIAGLAGLSVFQAYIAGTLKGFKEATIQAGLAHLQVSGTGDYFEEGEFNPFRHTIPDSESRMKRLLEDPRITHAFPSTGFTALAGFGEKSITLLVKGYPAGSMALQEEGKIPPETSFVVGRRVEGHIPGERSPDSDFLVLGETAARILGVKTGDVITLMAVLPEGGLEGKDFTVTGIFSSPGKDTLFAYGELQAVQEFIGLKDYPVIHLYTAHPDKVDELAEDLKGDYSVRTWKELAGYYSQVSQMFGSFLSVIGFILLFTTLFILANTMNRVVFERTREIGTLRSMGTTPVHMVSLIVLESGFLGLAGSLLGILLGFLAGVIINLLGGIPFVYNSHTVMIQVSLYDPALWLNIVPLVAVSAAAALPASLRAVKLSPAECLRQI